MSSSQSWRATGKRKTSVARVILRPGSGQVFLRKWRRLPKGTEVHCPRFDHDSGEQCGKVCDFSDSLTEGQYGVPKCPEHGKKPFKYTPVEEYFNRETQRLLIQQPIETARLAGKVDVWANVAGGGQSGQAGAVKHGIARALLEYEKAMGAPVVTPEPAEGGEGAEPVPARVPIRAALKRAGMLTRDARKKERKKYGQPGARKRFQYSKR